MARAAPAWLACAALLGCTSQPEADEQSVAPLLGVPYGQLATIEADAYVDRPAKGDHPPMLRVLRIDGRPAPADLCIRWTYGGWYAHREEATGRDGFTIAEGDRYRLRGYETGSWFGIPPVHEILGDDFGPPQGVNFHFRRWFRVIDGERLGSDAPRASHDAATSPGHGDEKPKTR